MNVEPGVLEARVGVARSRVADYIELTKPRVTAMVLVTTFAGFYLGVGASFDFLVAINLLVGTALASAGTLALNQYIERDADAMMRRTRRRPLPDGRLRPAEALWFGALTTTGGIGYLLVTVNPLTAVVIAATTATYLFAYTPLKRVSWGCNLVGAIPGALPPVAGWAAAGGGLSIEPLMLFAIIFMWQLPHSLSIAKLYREDYRRAGIWLLPPEHPHARRENLVIVGASAALVGVSVAPALLGFAGSIYLVAAGVLGIVMLICSLALVWGPETAAAARRVMFASLLYLPVVLLIMALDKV
jgi:heme o synthase